jgi:cysteine-rich repeat protein
MSSPSPVQTDAGEQVVAECDQAVNGTPCGTPGAGTHCIFNACVRNACGDGVRVDGEACDDGNERDGDGCSAHCVIDIPGCGNSKLEGSEECDDGNRNDADDCTNRCTKARCGDGVKGPNEACDDGNSNEADECTSMCSAPVDASVDASVPPRMDAGKEAGTLDAMAEAAVEAAVDAGRDAPVDTGPETSLIDVGLGTDVGTGSSACDSCRAAMVGVACDLTDLAKGCFAEVNGDFGADTADPLFIQQCVDIIVCARAWRCAYNLDLRPFGGEDYHAADIGSVGCYCGAQTLDACQAGPAPDAKCRAQWEAGARSTATGDVLGRISDLQYPVAWGFFLLDCDRSTQCAAECAPK